MISYVLLGVLLALICGAVFVETTFASPPVLWTPPRHSPMDNDVLLRMIALTENWDGESTGAAGERGPCQMLLSTWKNYSSEDMPYTARAWKNPEPQRVLRAHASWIRDQMEKANRGDTPYMFALFWKGGYGRAMNHRERRVDIEYALRAANIYIGLAK